MKLLRVFLLALAVATLGVACGDDEQDPLKIIPPCLDCEKEDPLLRLEQAFNQRRIEWYRGVLDDTFIFRLAPGDVAQGLPELWDRAEDVALTSRMFDRNCYQVCIQKITVDFKTDGVHWVEIDPNNGSGETWYQAVVFNDYSFEVGPDTYLSKNGAKVQFTLRNAGSEAEPAWRLVEWRELDVSEPPSGATAVATDQRSWGEIKSLYMP